MKKILAVVLTLAMIISASPAVFAAEAADSDLVAAWNFDVLNSDNTVADITGNGNDLILQDTAYEIVDGFSGKTFDFNGGTTAYDNSKHLVIDSDNFVPQINGSNEVTITAFVKKEVKGSGTNFTMFALNAGLNSIMVYGQASKIAVSSRSGATGSAVSTSADIIWPNADDASAPDSWMHVAVVLDYLNDNVKIYADGVLVGEEKAEEAPQSFTTDYADYKSDVGNIATGYFGVGGRHVRVDDLKVYRRALTQDEIKESIPPVLSYDFEEVCDGKIKDASAHKMDITVDETDTPTVIEGAQGNTIALTKTAYFPADTFTGMLYGAKEFAVSAWVKFPNGTGAAANTELHILNDEIGTGTKAKFFSFSFKGRNGYLGLRSRNSTGSFDSMGYVQAVNVRGAHNDTAWRHVYIEADIANKTGKVYFDGVLKDTNATSLSNLGLAYLNPTPDGAADTLNLNSAVPIYVDSVNVYRRTLTEKEIAKAAGAQYVFSNDASSVSAVCFPENISGADENTQYVLAMYDASGALKDCCIAKDASEVSLSIKDIDSPASYTYQLIVLKSMESLTPVIKAADYTVK